MSYYQNPSILSNCGNNSYINRAKCRREIHNRERIGKSSRERLTASSTKWPSRTPGIEQPRLAIFPKQMVSTRIPLRDSSPDKRPQPKNDLNCPNRLALGKVRDIRGKRNRDNTAMALSLL